MTATRFSAGDYVVASRQPISLSLRGMTAISVTLTGCSVLGLLYSCRWTYVGL